MSLLAAPVVSLLFFSVFAVAVIRAPSCTSPTWEWSFNSLGQNACVVAAYMMSTCSQGSFAVEPLPPGSTYSNPSVTDNSNLCKCSTIGYSLLSACAGCQRGNFVSWSEYVTNCSETQSPSSFPNSIPSGTSVPQWALLDVTNENFWNPNKSYATGDSPELGPGTVLGTPSSSSSSVSSISTSTTRSSNTSTSIPVREHSSNAGAIAGGVIAGIAAISILVAALLFYLRRRRSLVPTVVFEGDSVRHMDQVQFPMSDQGLLAETTAPPKPYNPDDPTTYPEHHVVQPPPAYISDQTPFLSSNTSLYTVAAPPTPQTPGYRGLPIV